MHASADHLADSITGSLQHKRRHRYNTVVNQFHIKLGVVPYSLHCLRVILNISNSRLQSTLIYLQGPSDFYTTAASKAPRIHATTRNGTMHCMTSNLYRQTAAPPLSQTRGVMQYVGIGRGTYKVIVSSRINTHSGAHGRPSNTDLEQRSRARNGLPLPTEGNSLSIVNSARIAYRRLRPHQTMR